MNKSVQNLTLDDTWDYCMLMWECVARRTRRPYPSVERLKDDWLEENDFDLSEVYASCFFCEYSKQHSIGTTSDCKNCPAVLVDSNFECMCNEYDFYNHPIKFYNKLKELNEKRIKK